jgi:hypothetical protein
MTEVAKLKHDAGVPSTNDEFDRMMNEDSGVGVSRKAADNLVPRIGLLQPLSPLVTSGAAAAGDFTLGEDIVAGKTGFYFQPAYLDQLWLEFRPLDEGGGFVAAHPFTSESDPPAGAKQTKPFRWRSDAGNELIHYRQMAGLAWRERIGLEFVIPFKSTGHTVAREWNTRSGRTNVLPDGRARSLFNHVWHLTSVMVKKGPYTWFSVHVGDAVLLAAANAARADVVVGDWRNAYLRGRSLNAAFASHEKVGELDTEPEARAADAGNDDELEGSF